MDNSEKLKAALDLSGEVTTLEDIQDQILETLELMETDDDEVILDTSAELLIVLSKYLWGRGISGYFVRDAVSEKYDEEINRLTD